MFKCMTRGVWGQTSLLSQQPTSPAMHPADKLWRTVDDGIALPDLT